MLRPAEDLGADLDQLLLGGQPDRILDPLSDTCRFLLATNEVSKLIPAIRSSRLMDLRFDIRLENRPEEHRRLVERYQPRLSAEGITFDRERLIQIVGIYYSDRRSIANRLEFEFA
jgi:DNA polymerase III delta prime subunit